MGRSQSTMMLPPELIQAISHELKSNEDIKSFRLTCKQTNQALATEALRRITVNVNKQTFEKELCKLRYLAEGCLLIRGIRQVDIKSLSPDLDPDIEWPVLDTKGGAASEEEELRKCLYNALSSLKNARTVRWTPGHKDREWAQIAAMDAIKTFHNLQGLHIELEHCRIEIPFHFFTALRHISVHDVGDDRNTFKNLVKMISQSPLLESIEFSSINFDYRILTRSLHQLFESSPDHENGSIPPLRLTHLSLARCFVRLDDETVMRHLRHLTSLSLDDLVHPRSPYHLYSGYSDDVYVDDSVSEDQNQWGSNYEQIWRIICNTDLRLEEITLCRAPLALLEYIGSYSGLRKLKVSTGAFEDEVASDSAAKKFYEALERHASSIEELHVMAFHSGLWCFGHHNKALFSTFQNLTTLSVKVQSMAAGQDIINLIDTAAIYMPRLQALSVSIVEQQVTMSPRPSEIFPYTPYNWQKIIAQVLKYKAPLGCKHLPMFTLVGSWSGPGRVFFGQSLGLLQKGERLGYDKISPPGFEYNTDSDEE